MDDTFGILNGELEEKVSSNEVASVFDITDKYDELIEQESRGANSETLSHLFRKCYEGIKNLSFSYFGSILQN